MNELFWMHSDCLTTPPFEAVYIFDDEQLRLAGWGLKRLMFVYECLLELPVEIHRGSTLEILRGFNRPLVTVDSPDPWIRGVTTQLAIDVRPAPAFVELAEPVDLRRFSRYWKRVKFPEALSDFS